jgi:hypothetical protein
MMFPFLAKCDHTLDLVSRFSVMKFRRGLNLLMPPPIHAVP